MTDFQNQLTIETPEQVHLDLHIAGIGSRFMAFAIDTLIQFLLYMLILVIFAFGVSQAPRITGEVDAIGENWLVAILIFVHFLLYWGYFAIFETVWKGQTPGKKNVGIRVVKQDGSMITPGEAASRNFLRIIDALPGMYGFGLISMVISKENRRIGDYVAGTLVIHEKEAAEMHVDLQQLGDAPSREIIDTRPLSIGDLELMETFLHRRLTFEDNVRWSMASRIATHLETKLGCARPVGTADEDYIQLVAKAMRDQRHG